jgi:hypothetical protein
MLRTVLRGAGCGVVAAVVTLAGSVWHRSSVALGPVQTFPLGLILGFVAVAGVAVGARAAAGWAGLIGAAAGAFLIAQAVALRGPGGDILIQGDATGFIWIAGAPVLTLLAALAPRSWFRRDVPEPPAGPEPNPDQTEPSAI